MRAPRLLRRLLLVAILGGLVALPAGHDPAVAGCVGPRLVEPAAAGGVPAVPEGRAFTVDGEAFGGTACNDTGSGNGNGLACHRGEEEPDPLLVDVRLLLRQGGRTWELGEADAADGGRISWDVTVPDDVPPGRAVLVAEPGGSDNRFRLPVMVR